METGFVVVEKIDGKSTVTRCFSKYPLKLIIPKKACSSTTDAVWIFSLSYGGGIVSGDRLVVGLSVGDGCTVAYTTQTSTKEIFVNHTALRSAPSFYPTYMDPVSKKDVNKNKNHYLVQVYKSVGSKSSEQILEAKVGRNALLAVIPDPVTCFSNAIYSQKQVFRVSSDSNLVIVDWITSGRHESGEKWNFELYKSSNSILLGDVPFFIDSVLLEQRSSIGVAERMKDYQVVAMVVIMGPKLKHIQDQIQGKVRDMMSGYFRPVTVQKMNSESANGQSRPLIFASCSSFGDKAGVVVRLMSLTTEAVYAFLRDHLGGLEQFLGAPTFRLYR